MTVLKMFNLFTSGSIPYIPEYLSRKLRRESPIGNDPTLSRVNISTNEVRLPDDFGKP